MVHVIIDGIKAIIKDEDVNLFKKIEAFHDNVFTGKVKLTTIDLDGIKCILDKKDLSKSMKKLEKAIKKIK